MKTGVTNIFGMLALEKIEPIFEENLVRVRQEGCYSGDYLIGIVELKVKFNNNRIVINKNSLENMKFTIYDDLQFYQSILESQIGNEIIVGEQI